MSRDIRSYFQPTGASKKKVSNKDTRSDDIAKPRKRHLVISSDSDEEPLPKEVKKQKGQSVTSPPPVKNKQKKDKNVNKPDLKPVSVADVFGTSQIKRAATKTGVEEKIQEVDLASMLEDQHSDLEFEATLLQLDEQENLLNSKLALEKEKKPSKESTPPHKKHKHTHESDKDKRKHNKDSENQDSDFETGKILLELDDQIKSVARKFTSEQKSPKDTSPPCKKHKDSQKSDKGRHKHSKEKSSSASEKLVNGQKQELNKTVEKDKERKKSSDDSLSEDAFEKKRQHAMQYQRYLSREGPRNPGGKEIPEGTPGCLSGLVFVLTGVLETIDREQTTSIIQQYGGRVTSSLSRNTNYLVVGDEPGPSKIEKAMKLGTKQLTEDGLLDLIRTSSGRAEGSSKFKKSKDEAKVPERKEAKPVIAAQKKEEKKPVKVEESFVKKGQDIPTSADVKSSPPKVADVKSSSLWVDKYKPVSTKQIIGQQGDRSNVKKLLKWLQNWHSNHSGNKKLPKPSPWSKDDSGAFYKAALLSGPPGVGKTTSANLVCKELGFDAVEFNASDTRSMKLLRGEVSELLTTKSLSGYFEGGAGMKPTEKHVLVMDEVDGMAGNEDRGGIQELIQMIKSTRVPIICMCNDRHHPKIRSLTNYCFDLQFSKPRAEQIRGAMMSICFKEGIKISPEGLNDIISGANQDIRQILHHLSMWTVNDKQLSAEQAKEEAQKAKKNLKLGPWDVLRKVFAADAHKTMSIHDRSDLFFHDYSLGPLFVQENYLSVLPHKAKGNRNKHLELVAKTAESLSSGDLVEKAIRNKMAWSLLPTQAMYSSVIPGDVMEGHLTRQINFPAWLGKNSRRNKFNRLVQELHMHMRLSISGSREAVNLDYLQHIRDALMNPLVKEGSDGVPATLSVMQNYYLMREDIDSVLELSLWPNQKDPMSSVDSKVKAALTRTYNKEGIMTPYSVVNIKKSSGKASQDSGMDMEVDGDNAEEDEEEEEEDITKDAMIKAKKRPASSKGDSAGEGSAPKRGRGRGGGGKKESKSKGK